MTITDKITLSTLLLSQDSELVEVVRDLARNMHIEVEECAELLQATRRIAAVKYQGVMLDWNEDIAATALLNAVRASTSNASDVVFAFASDGEQAVAATRLGANFIIPRPATPESVGPYIRAGYGLMVHELRRYFRCPAVVPVRLERRGGPRWLARSLNISSGGLAVSSVATRLVIGEWLAVSFQVPGSNIATEATVTVCWVDDIGRAGLKFDRLSTSVERTIEQWLATRIDEGLTERLA